MGCCLIAVFTLMLLGGCRTDKRAARLAVGQSPCPTVLVTYYAYGPSLVRSAFAPVPDYDGWPDERMERDCDRLIRSGADVVVIVLEIGELSEEVKRERVRRFAEVLEKGRLADGLALCIGIWARAPMTLTGVQREESLRWLGESGLVQMGSYYRPDGTRGALFVDDSVGQLPGHPALALYTGLSVSPESGGGAPGSAPPVPCSVQQGPAGVRAVVTAGSLAPHAAKGHLRKAGSWTLPRAKGTTLRDGFREARAAGAGSLWVSSWNNYQRGDAIEPNTFDGSAVLKTLQREVGRLR